MENNGKQHNLSMFFHHFSICCAVVAICLPMLFGCLGVFFMPSHPLIASVCYFLLCTISGLTLFFLIRRLAKKTSFVSAQPEKHETSISIMNQAALQQIVSGDLSAEDEIKSLLHLLKLDDPSLRYFVMYCVVLKSEASHSFPAKFEEWQHDVIHTMKDYYSFRDTFYYFLPPPPALCHISAVFR